MASQTQMLSEWHHFVGGLAQPSEQFYADVEASVERREIPGLEFRRVEFKEGGMFSAKRQYLRVKRDDLYFDIFGGTFAKGFFISERLFLEGSFLEGMGTAGGILKALAKPDTMYKYDTALVMQELVHEAVLETIDVLTATQQLAMVPTDRRKPLMRDFYQLGGAAGAH